MPRNKMARAAYQKQRNGPRPQPSYTVALLPAAASASGETVVCSDGMGGLPCLAYSNGTSWLVVGQGIPVKATAYTVATLPAAAAGNAGAHVYCSNGAAGAPCYVFSSGAAGNWLRCDTLATAAAA